MLEVARELRRRRASTSWSGVVETHGRDETAALLEGSRSCRGARSSTAARRSRSSTSTRRSRASPQLILVDELAHTNAPGSRHAKRWQDVLELLDAGIDVYTTLNVQHVESLNDVVAQITGVQRARDGARRVLERADEIELVDIAPEELLSACRRARSTSPSRRSARPSTSSSAATCSRCASSRCAAPPSASTPTCRSTARSTASSATWPTGERILVCVGPAPALGAADPRGRAHGGGAARAVGRRLRRAAGARAAAATRDRERLEAHLRLAESLGAHGGAADAAPTWPSALLGYARKHNVTRIVVGKPTHSRLRDRLRGSLLDEVVRGSGDIDVHVISGDDDARRREPHARPRPAQRRVRARYVWAAAAGRASRPRSGLARARAAARCPTSRCCTCSR